MTSGSDLAWARRRGGLLTRWDRLRLVGDFLRLQLRNRLVGPPPALSIATADIGAAITLPDSSLAGAALAECMDGCIPPVVAHCLRTFAWGCLVGVGRKLRFDREALAVACLLHDIELGKVADRGRTACGCFACASGLHAQAFALRHGRDAAWAAIVGDAIALHLDPMVPLSRGAEAHLLQAGAAIDVIGLGLRAIPPAARATVLSRHPRDGFEDAFVECLEREAASEPNTRAGLLMSRGFATRIRRSSLARLSARPVESP